MSRGMPNTVVGSPNSSWHTLIDGTCLQSQAVTPVSTICLAHFRTQRNSAAPRAPWDPNPNPNPLRQVARLIGAPNSSWHTPIDGTCLQSQAVTPVSTICLAHFRTQRHHAHARATRKPRSKHKHQPRWMCLIGVSGWCHATVDPKSVS